ncbi:MlaE family lipid ABC transporter permease subunit [Oscillatoria sp. CS-180]|uniref:MlaE family lipid ABC transporter permease subunit n=1 Tax=Oscillatoria sp. CS-180 TaxID=3021720 RepID=UPI00232B9367|nr:MlaE family lipid ABC transporter permease subunit [Oscillatoria sp. CS-180]MDB9527973.1 MlaE family lipid ABC transporter permease subunit [Oscillatoria sp. CS-180]
MINPFRLSSPDNYAAARKRPLITTSLSPYTHIRTRSCAYHIMMAVLLGGQVLMRILRGRVRRHQVMEQMVMAGPGALMPVLMTNLFAGMIFSIQTAREMARFGAISALGGAFAMGFCRELAPILTAAILAGQVGSAFASEIGSMKITEQIDALKVLRTDPIDYLVVPRVVACCVMLPVLTVTGLVLGVVGGLFAASFFFNVQGAIFLESVQTLLEPMDLVAVLLKAVIFGTMIALAGCTWGLTTTCSKGLGRSATSAVVTTWVGLFVVDFFITVLLFHGLQITY